MHCSAQRVGFFNIGSGQVLDKIPGSGSSSGRVGVSKTTIGYFRVFFYFRVFPGISGTSGYVRYFWVFLGLPIYTKVISTEGALRLPTTYDNHPTQSQPV